MHPLDRLLSVARLVVAVASLVFCTAEVYRFGQFTPAHAHNQVLPSAP